MSSAVSPTLTVGRSPPPEDPSTEQTSHFNISSKTPDAARSLTCETRLTRSSEDTIESVPCGSS